MATMSDLAAMIALLTSYDEVRLRLHQERDATAAGGDHELRLRLLETRIVEKLVRWTGQPLH